MSTFTLHPQALDLGLLLMRFVLGAIFFAHGAQKVLGWYGGYGLKGTSGFFKQAMGIPVPLSYLAAFAEFLGGIAVIVGAFTQIAAMGLAVTMLVAVIKVHGKNGFWMNWSSTANKGEGYEYNLALFAMALLLMLVGPGRFSIIQ
jgi:putative oxidoreductase